jgi:signal transduction histidine kinase
VAELDSPVFVVGEDDRLVDVNEAGRAFLDGDALGDPVGTVFAAYPTLQECQQRGQGVEGFVTDHDGQRRYYDVTVLSLSGATQGGSILKLSEVTTRQRRKEALEEQNERLELLASSIAHDLRNPLNVAKLNVGLLGDEPHREEAGDQIAESLDRMEAIIDDMLTLARHDGRVDTETLLLSDAAGTAWGNVATADATLTVADDGSLRADHSQLLTLLENLFRNSVEHGSTGSRSQAGQDAGDHGQGSVTVTVGLMEAGVFIADDGPGIPASDRCEVFEHGYTTHEDGTGFGLAIVERIADAHGWSVTVTDADAGGARFEVTGITRPEQTPAD